MNREQTTSFYLYRATCKGKDYNTLYKTKEEITTLDDLKRAAKYDHIVGEMQTYRRGKGRFIKANCIIADLDNNHSNEPDEWETFDDIADAFEDVEFYAIESRHHMKQKTKKNKKTGEILLFEPRPKYHFYFPIGREVEKDEYYKIVKQLQATYPHFDASVAEPNHFLYGVDDPQGVYIPGTKTIETYLQENPPAEQLQDDRETTEQLQQEPAAPEEIEWLTQVEQERREQWLQEWAQKNNVFLGKRYVITAPPHTGAIVYCITCPWEHEHSMTGTENETVIMIEQSGQLAFLCRHSHGANYSWKDYRAEIERRTAAAGAQRAPQNDFTVSSEGIDHATENDAHSAQYDPTAPLPGLLTAADAMQILEKVDDHYLEMPRFNELSKILKLRRHDTIVIAADTGAGKSSLALNFLYDLQDRYPALYINLEMDEATILQRLVAIHTGMILDRIEGYKHDEKTRAEVNTALEQILSRKEIQLLTDTYDLKTIEENIKIATQGREEPTIVFIDTALLVTTGNKTTSRYERFTHISEELRRISRQNNIILFALLQQNREGKNDKGKSDKEKRPTNSSLKESGSWENDATKILFLWNYPKEILITKNRSGQSNISINLDYSPLTQYYAEESGGFTPLDDASAFEEEQLMNRY